MDQAVIKYYRKLLKTGFKFYRSFENASIFLNNVGEKVLICTSTGDYMQLYVNVVNNRIVDIRYMYGYDPIANVAVEILCTLMKDKPLDEATAVKEKAFYQLLGSNGEELQKGSKAYWDCLMKGLPIIKTQTPSNTCN